MPIYEYVCKACNNSFEVLVRSSAAVACPSCKSTSLEKQVSVFAQGRAAYARGKGSLTTSPVSESDYAAACAAVGDARGPDAFSPDD